MRVIIFVTQKGGAGKTTLTVNCAVAAARRKKRVLILDLDAQASAENWYQDREAETPQLVKASSWELPDALARAKTAGFDYVMIDTPGRDEPSTTAAIRAADFCIVPCRPTPVDLKATLPTVDTIKRLAKPAAFVLTQTPPRGERSREAEVGLGCSGWSARSASSPAPPIRMPRGQGSASTSSSLQGRPPPRSRNSGTGLHARWRR